jgi:hypothetical protein
VVAVAAVLWPLVVTLRFAAGMYPDTRDQAAAWLLDEAAPGDWVLATPYAPVLPPGRFRTWPLANEVAVRRIVGRQAAVKYLVLSDFYTARFADNPDDAPERAAFLAWLGGSGEEVARFAAPGPRFGFFQPTITVRRIPAAVAPELGATHARDGGLTGSVETP